MLQTAIKICDRIAFDFYTGLPHMMEVPNVLLFNTSATLEKCRAGGNGTAGTAMAVLVFEGEKWRRLDSNLACVMECPLRALRRSLGRLRGL